MVRGVEHPVESMLFLADHDGKTKELYNAKCIPQILAEDVM